MPQAAQLPQTGDFFNKESVLWKKFCPRQRSCPGQVTSSKKESIFWKKSAPGSAAAPDR